MQTALRAHHNPALLLARTLAQSSLPGGSSNTSLLVLALVPASAAPAWWRTERRAAFMLQVRPSVRPLTHSLSLATYLT